MSVEEREIQSGLLNNLMKVVARECNKEKATPEEVSALAEVADVIVKLLTV